MKETEIIFFLQRVEIEKETMIKLERENEGSRFSLIHCSTTFTMCYKLARRDKHQHLMRATQMHNLNSFGNHRQNNLLKFVSPIQIELFRSFVFAPDILRYRFLLGQGKKTVCCKKCLFTSSNKKRLRKHWPRQVFVTSAESQMSCVSKIIESS